MPETLATWYLAGVASGAGTLAGLWIAYQRGLRDARAGWSL